MKGSKRFLGLAGSLLLLFGASTAMAQVAQPTMTITENSGAWTFQFENMNTPTSFSGSGDSGDWYGFGDLWSSPGSSANGAYYINIYDADGKTLSDSMNVNFYNKGGGNFGFYTSYLWSGAAAPHYGTLPLPPADATIYEDATGTAIADFSTMNGTNLNNLKIVIHSTEAPVPEPTTMLFLGLGLVSVAGLKRKFKS